MILNDIVWAQDQSDAAISRAPRFTNAHGNPDLGEHGRKGAFDSVSNYRAMKTLNDELQMRSDWVMPICGRPLSVS